MPVRQHHAVQPANPALLEPRNDRQFADATAVAYLPAAINERSGPIVTFQERGIAMTDVQPS